MMLIEGVHTIPGRGTVVSGRVEHGVINIGQPVEVIGLSNDGAELVVTGTQAFRKDVDERAWCVVFTPNCDPRCLSS
ncbi:EF-Tu/IF-2/RF-3 family GTPase [Aliiroseovarius halocynthiae]|uniref:Translation elongation factor EFTu-like domain-containing protein n=1 Tax=Aliiroseovarius halocynthiae TaxID=985055 RepID=A0A545SUV3_9RHOB|nr:EF-Tu/IF-2/RF-3 family GTPase [Aliiroseovarius halocynthiae]TQV68736.1 hypothetical protein FIL88_03910 [Aliiroseovarius halocynthiae]